MISPAIMKSRYFPGELCKMVYTMAALLALIGIFTTRWNVIIGGQLFSKSLRGLTVYKIQHLGMEGSLMALALLILPLVILAILMRILPPWPETEARLEPVPTKGWGG